MYVCVTLPLDNGANCKVGTKAPMIGDTVSAKMATVIVLTFIVNVLSNERKKMCGEPLDERKKVRDERHQTKKIIIRLGKVFTRYVRVA